MTLNVAGLSAGLEPVARAIRDLAPDVACLQEVPRGAFGRLARACGLRGIGPARLGPRVGNAVLAAGGVAVARRVRLSRSRALAPRELVVARVGSGVEGGLTVASFHLGLDAGERARHRDEIVRALPPEGVLIVCGDANDTVPADLGLSDPCARAGPTFPADQPRARIDVILVRGIDVYGCTAMHTGVSDHLAVCAEVAG